jgi:predicted AAA+ superfamily ATPase
MTIAKYIDFMNYAKIVETIPPISTNKDNNKITEPRAILQRESQNS